MALVFYNKRYATKGNDAKNPAILGIFHIERTQLNVEHPQLLEKLRPVAFAETCRILTIQSLEFYQNSAQKKKFRNHVNDLFRKI